MAGIQGEAEAELLEAELLGAELFLEAEAGREVEGILRRVQHRHMLKIRCALCF